METQHVPSNLELYPRYYSYMKKVVNQKNGLTSDNEDDLPSKEETENPSDSSTDDN